jgi:hypothetical protein
MARRYRPADLKLIIDELTDENDRVRAVVGGSLLDGLLDYAIVARIRALEPGEESKLFKPGGPFHSCDQKIQAGYALGLFGSLTKSDMACINEVRNIFAHEMNPVDFDAEVIIDRSKNLRSGSGIDVSLSTRDRFVFAIHWIMDGLVTDANEFTENQLQPVSRRLSD